MTATMAETFEALADPTRLAIVQRLSRGPASVSELAAPHDMSLRAVLKHVHVLEEAGVVKTGKRGRVRECELTPRQLERASQFLEQVRARWDARVDRIERYLDRKEAP
jgi:DNA-binding transcriptional ArsR family regulator